jgi:prepilin-type N-terminal cleavage/methylation domain-containing protein
LGYKLKRIIKNNKKKYKGFSLVELLLALAIFGIVVSANFGLALDAYRSRQNDRTRLEAGLVIKDTINSLYSIKNASWSEMISYFDEDPDGLNSRIVEVVNNKIVINFGEKNLNNITYEVYFKKAFRSTAGVLEPTNEGTDPDTIKIVVVATWSDMFNNTQQLTENYFLTNWSSTTWSEYDDSTFNILPPVLINSKVENDSVSVSEVTPIANSDWCNIIEDSTTKSYDLFPVGSGSSQAIASNVQPGEEIVYEMYEPALTGPIPTNAPAPVAPVMPALNNSNLSICDGTGTTPTQCESLIRFYDSTNGDAWTDNTDWTETNTPCSWFGVTCSAGNVDSVSLPNNNLTGSLPTEIGNLTGLTTLNLTGNAITGSIPPQIGRLTDLSTLDLSDNQLDGVIPKTIGNNTNLSILNLSLNALDGQIPSSIGRLSTLDELYLQNNTLTCHVPTTIANLSEIDSTKLDLSNNNLMLPSSVTLLDTYLTTTKSAVMTNQGATIEHEDCVYKPSTDNIYIAKFKPTIVVPEPAIYLNKFSNGAFPPDMTETIISDVDWESDTNSGGLSFDGIDDVAVIDYNSKWNVEEDMTIMAWVKSNDTSQDAYARFIDFSDDTSEGWYLSFAIPNKVYFFHYGSVDLEIETGTPIDDSEWTHLAVVISNGTGTMYVNGLNPISEPYTDLIPADTDQELRFANDSTGTMGSEIDLDEVRIYDRALSQNEILKSYETEINRNDPGLVGYWRMNITNPLDQIFYDYSYQGMHGTRGTDLTTTKDPSLITGIAKYRVNDIYKYNDKLYLSTTNPSEDVVVYDLLNNTTNTINFTAPSNDDTQGVVIASDTRGYAIQDNSVIQFDPSTNIAGDYQNLSTGSGLRSLIDLKLNSNQLYFLGLDSDGNFGIMDVTNGITPTPRVNNLLLEAFM